MASIPPPPISKKQLDALKNSALFKRSKLLFVVKAGIAVTGDRKEYKEMERNVKCLEYFLQFVKSSNLIQVAAEVLVSEPPEPPMWAHIQQELKDWATKEKGSKDYQRVRMLLCTIITKIISQIVTHLILQHLQTGIQCLPSDQEND